jgi:hypothetical protein
MDAVDPHAIAPDMTSGRTFTMKSFNSWLVISYYPGMDALDREAYNLSSII